MPNIEIKPEGIPELIDYRGWTIWCWTGWKGEKGIARCDDQNGCPQCGKPFKTGDVLWLTQSSIPRHWTCMYPDNPPSTLHAQWLALKGETPKTCRYVEANCGVMTVAELPAGEYQRGDSFEIVPEHLAITEDTPEDVREAAKQLGFERLKLVINQIEDAA